MTGNQKTEIRDENWVMARRNENHGLLPVQRALSSLGDPQDKIRTIHVAGTNGKGSTCNYLKDILLSEGYKVGTFTSPHLEAHRDRIRINGEWIPQERFLYYLQKDMTLIEEENLGMFEIDLIVAMEYFYDEGVDYAIVETGLGGRLDNTNVIHKPLLEIITTIGYDHMNILGDRIEQIAFEKAGIIKPYTACIVGAIDERLIHLMRLQAARRHAHVQKVQNIISKDDHHFVFAGREYCIQGASYQKENAAVALQAAAYLGIDIRKQSVIDAVKNSFWKGRFEKVASDPDVYVDGAHNAEAMKALVRNFAGLKKPIAAVYSALSDKPQKEMADLLARYADHLVITHFDNPRASEVNDLGVADAIVEADWKKAIEIACEKVPEGTVVITGSLYFVSLVREYYQ